jgi:hypothetical protein
VKLLKEVQTYHLETCIFLLKLAIFFLLLEVVWAAFSIFHFGCGVGDCQNTLICCLHYIKFAQALFLCNSYYQNIKERQQNHPIGTINSFLVVVLYYVSLYAYQDSIKEDRLLIHFCVVYPAIDFFLILVSYFAIRKVKAKRQQLLDNKDFKEYRQEATIALSDVLYLP